MKIFIISDTHFEHERLVTHCGRPKGFEYKILNALPKIVQREDVLINLGDFCWHRDAYWHEQYMLYARCKNWITIGNHDSKNASWYLSHGWDWAGEMCTLEIHGVKILFSHLPQKDGDYTWNVHGHFHNTSLQEQLDNEPEIVARLTKKHILVAVEYTNYKPVEIQQLLKER